MSPFASYPSANAWIDTIVTRFKPSIDETALARTGLSGAAARTALLDLELEILQHPNLIALAKKQRNASRPACSLPVEILARVVWFAQPFWRPTRYKSKYSIGWMSLSHVCSGWREATLASSGLWRFLSCFNHPPRAVPELLARCQQQTIGLNFTSDYSDDPPHAVALCQTLMSTLVSQRVQSLHIHQTQALFSRSGWLSLLRNPMPVLEVLSIKIPHFGSTPTEDLILPVDIGAMPSPRLSSIALRGCRLPWISPLYNANIVTLDLRMTIRGQESDLSSQLHFYNALGRMPALKKLTLENAFPIFTHDMDSAVRLKHLEQLTFASHYQSTGMNALKTLLSFELPRELRCHVGLFTQGPPAEPDIISRAFAHVFRNLPETPLALRISQIAFETKPFLEGAVKKRDCTMPGWQDVCSNWQLGSWGLLPRERRFRISYGYEWQLMPQLSLVQMSSLRHITVTADVMRHTAGAETWKEVFSPAQQVQSLALNFTPPLSALLSALTDTTTDTDTQNTRMSIFPVLKMISLSYEYGDPEEVEAPRRIPVGEGDCLRLQFALIELVHARQRCATRFEKLVVEEGVLDPAILRQVAEEIEVEVF